MAACPTKTSTWEAGGNQPFEAGPGYDCAAGTVFGSLAADGASISFPLDSTVLPASGPLSLALAPLPDGTAPFSIDLSDPVYTPAEASPAAGTPAADPAPAAAAPPPAAPPPGDAGSLASGSTDEAPAVPDVAEAPAPELAGAEALPAADAPSAPLAEEVPPVAAPTAVLPAARLVAGETDQGRDGPRVLALLTLVAVSAGAGYAAGQQRPAPRLLGGRAASAAGTSLVVREQEQGPDPRGIGRFSRVRDAAPRRLR